MAGNGNSFLNCDIGVESNQSRTFILGNRFDRLFKVAINAFYDGELLVRDQNQFLQCPEGVITTQKVASVEIRNNIFVNTKRGVFNYRTLMLQLTLWIIISQMPAIVQLCQRGT